MKGDEKMDFSNLSKYDQEVMKTIELEINRQQEHIELIALKTSCHYK